MGWWVEAGAGKEELGGEDELVQEGEIREQRVEVGAGVPGELEVL